MGSTTTHVMFNRHPILGQIHILDLWKWEQQLAVWLSKIPDPFFRSKLYRPQKHCFLMISGCFNVFHIQNQTIFIRTGIKKRSHPFTTVLKYVRYGWSAHIFFLDTSPTSSSNFRVHFTNRWVCLKISSKPPSLMLALR